MARSTPVGQRPPASLADLAVFDAVPGEATAAGTIVIGAPMYDFGILAS